MPLKLTKLDYNDALRLWHTILDFAQSRAKDRKRPLTKSERIARNRLARAFRDTVGYDPVYVECDINGEPVKPHWDLAVLFPPKASRARS